MRSKNKILSDNSAEFSNNGCRSKSKYLNRMYRLGTSANIRACVYALIIAIL